MSIVQYKGFIYEEEGSNGPMVSADIAKMPANLGLFARFGYSNKNIKLYKPRISKNSKKKYFEMVEKEILEEMKEISQKHHTKKEQNQHPVKKETKSIVNLSLGHASNFGGGHDTTSAVKNGLDIFRAIRRYQKPEKKVETKTEKGA